MFAKFGRRLANQIRCKLGLKMIVLSGIKLSTNPQEVSSGARKLLLRNECEDQELILVRQALSPNDKVLSATTGEVEFFFRVRTH